MSLTGAHVGDRLSFERATLGMVDLTDAVVRRVHDGWRPAQADGSSHQYQLRRAGFVYQSLGPGSDGCKERLDWLRYAAEGYVPAVPRVINLGQESAWAPTGAAQYWYAFGVLAGWLLSLGFVAYLTAKLFRE